MENKEHQKSVASKSNSEDDYRVSKKGAKGSKESGKVKTEIGRTEKDTPDKEKESGKAQKDLEEELFRKKKIR